MRTEQLLEHFFRHESANLVAVLTRAFGVRRLELIEDAVQSAMLQAVHAWKQQGPPDRPAAWLHRAAKNRVLDALRRERVHEQALAHAGSALPAEQALLDDWLADERLPDSLLRMMFVGCHPALDRPTQVAFTLKHLCGFSVAEVARGLMLPAETVKKRLQRARTALADAGATTDLPPNDQLAERLEVVHAALYLMFNEGYSTSHGAAPIRDDVCEEAARLCHLLCQSPYATPATRALLALMCLHAARLDARVNEAGEPVLLEDQDRARWDRGLIAAARGWLAESRDTAPSTYHLEAAIALEHCLAKDLASTDWAMIVRLYDRLLELRPAPVCRLNRAIALGESGDTPAALAALEELRGEKAMRGYPLLECAIAKLHERAGEAQAAADAYHAALAMDPAEHERRVIEARLARLSE